MSKEIAKGMSPDELAYCTAYLNCLSVPDALAQMDMSTPEKKLEFEDIVTRENVRAYLDEKRKKIRDIYVTADDLVLQARQLYDKCVRSQPILSPTGHPTGEYKFDAKGAVKILELLFEQSGLIKKDKTQKIDVRQQIPDINITEKALVKFHKKFDKDY